MLWTDSIFITPQDLASLDSEIPTIAEDENVVLTGETGFIRRQIDEAGEEILRRMEVFGGWVGSSTLSANHIQGVMNIGGGAAASRTKILLNQVVVSDRIPNKWSHLTQWVVHRTLVSFYRNSYSRTASKDRYKSKLDEFNRLMLRQQNYILLDLGLPICYQPLPRPAAAFEINPGTWDTTNATPVANVLGTFAGNVDVAITYVDSSRYLSSSQNQNAESTPSDRLTISLIAGELPRVDITSLVPPDGHQDPGSMALCVYTPLTATHWNVYAGKMGSQLILQNSTPIPIATKTYDFTADLKLTGTPMGLGQYADRRYQFQIGQLQRA
jgi:hypothetical protein